VENQTIFGAQMQYKKVRTVRQIFDGCFFDPMWYNYQKETE